MFNWRILGTVLLLSLIIVGCAQATPVTVKETVPVPQTVIVPQTVVVQQPAPTVQPVAAVTPVPAAPKPVPPEAVLSIVPVAANAKDPNVVTATLKYVTDTVVGPKTSTLALGSPGLTNTSIGVPVHVAVQPADPKNPAKTIKWTLTAPKDSKAAIKDAAAANTEFTPDLPGMYKVDVALTNDAGTGDVASVQIHADSYIGEIAGNCKQCHANYVEGWSKTGHATIFTDQIDIKNGDYSETCIRCHTTGYNPGVKNGGFADVQATLNWIFPTVKQIMAGGNWNAAPAQIKNMANIQCEDCHGPAKDHVTTGAPVMAVSFDDGVCNVCHNGGGHHVKGAELSNSKHSDATADAFTTPTGPGEQACVRCHSGKGYVTFLDNPTNQAAWDNSPQTVGCSTCHDPHSDANPHQLRVFGTPVGLPFTAKDAGLSATCEECHNSRVSPANATKGSYPHYSSAAEFLNNTGGVDYGKTIPDSPHAAIVGVAPIPNPAFAKDPETNQFMFSAVGDTKGVTPGACVTCHMWPTVGNTDPNYLKVGEHSFNTVSPDGTFDYTGACQSCHAGMKDFNFTAKADYDGNGKVEGVQTEVQGLLNILWKALQDKGVQKVDSGYPYATLPKDSSGNVDPKIANAWFNFRTVYGTMWSTDNPGNQGTAQAIHDFNRAVSLLQLSYKDLTGQDVPNATIMVK